jgi:hypothetical protein
MPGAAHGIRLLGDPEHQHTCEEASDSRDPGNSFAKVDAQRVSRHLVT